jgi:hypothetical protein
MTGPHLEPQQSAKTPELHVVCRWEFPFLLRSFRERIDSRGNRLRRLKSASCRASRGAASEHCETCCAFAPFHNLPVDLAQRLRRHPRWAQVWTTHGGRFTMRSFFAALLTAAVLVGCSDNRGEGTSATNKGRNDSGASNYPAASPATGSATGTGTGPSGTTSTGSSTTNTTTNASDGRSVGGRGSGATTNSGTTGSGSNQTTGSGGAGGNSGGSGGSTTGGGTSGGSGS